MDDQGKLLYVEPHWNPSCALGSCPKALAEHINFEATQDADTGQIHFKWNLWNGMSSHISRNGETLGELQAEHGLIDHKPALMQFNAGAIPAIDGELILSPSMLPGSYELTYLDRDPFPSLEIYQYYDGQYQNTIATLPERGFVGNWGPVVWLNPLAPNERIAAR